jgi:hypothetical protein
VIDGKVRPDVRSGRWTISSQEFPDINQCNKYRDAYLKAVADALRQAKLPSSMVNSTMDAKTKYTKCVPSDQLPVPWKRFRKSGQ